MNPIQDRHRLSTKTVSTEVHQAIESLRGTLRQAYGLEFAFSILAEGHVIGASNLEEGVVVPRLFKHSQ